MCMFSVHPLINVRSRNGSAANCRYWMQYVVFFPRNTSDKCLPYAHTYAHDLRRCGGGDGIVRQSVTICHTEYANAGASEYIMLTPNTHAAYSGAFAP